MNKTKTSAVKALSLSAAIASAMFLAGCNGDSSTDTAAGVNKYEVWAADQSNSVAGVGARGSKGSFIWAWDSDSIDTQLGGGAAATPLDCAGVTSGTTAAGKKLGCDINAVFPQNLVDGNGRTLANSGQFGRLHGMLPDTRYGHYMNFNSFVTSTGGDGVDGAAAAAGDAGYVGIIDGRTKEAVALWKVSKTDSGANGGRSVHMSFWSKDSKHLYIANLHGKIVERIDMTYDAAGNMLTATLNKDAALSSGGVTAITETAQAYTGNNAAGNALISAVSGSDANADLGALTPLGNCRQTGCVDAGGNTLPGAGRGPGGHVIVCPIVSDTGMLYITFGSGGVLVADASQTPMKIVAEYTNDVLNGAGCGGVHIGDNVWLDAGASAAGGGRTQSMFNVWTVNDSLIAQHAANVAANPNTAPLPENFPTPVVAFSDAGNTNSGGFTGGQAPFADGTAEQSQLPSNAVRRDAHGMTHTFNQRYVHVNDRIGNTVEVFDSTMTGTASHVGTYSLTSADGTVGGAGTGACQNASVTDDAGLPMNDPAPDLMQATPDGKYIAVALRGPTPVSVTHAAQGSCPGVGMIEMVNGGASGKLVGVLRTYNDIDDAAQVAPGGHPYTGSERSDPHGASVRWIR